ncbi:hypothetical protein N9443_00280 [Schleiferiaceae bacterium]|nr:hypothetical protein [Schleiferiaceae bacterium]
MFNLSFIFGIVVSANSGLVLQNIHNQYIFYNFISYKNELYVGSNNGIYRVEKDSDGEIFLYDKAVKGPIKSDFTRDEFYKVRFVDFTQNLPDEYSNTITDFAYHGSDLLIISRGKLLTYDRPSYSFSPFESVRSISKNGIGSYSGVYMNGEILQKITYTDGQIREFEDVTMICYNGLLKYKDGKEVVVYDNDNSIRTNGEYGVISDIYSIGEFKYILISSKGIYEYDEQLDILKLVYTCQDKIIPIRNKIDNRIKDRGEFHFIDNKRYISLDINGKGFDIIDNSVKSSVIDCLECEKNGNHFYMVTKDDLLLKYERSVQGLELISQITLESPAHTIMDYKDLLFLSGDNGLNIYNKTKNQFAYDFIIDEFNRSAVYKSESEISLGGLHGIYKFSNLNALQKELVFKDYEIRNNRNLVYYVIIIGIIGLIILRLWKKRNISDDEMILRIKRFTRSNLTKVTVKMIEEEFGLDYNELNNLSKGFKPAKYIKEQRVALTKKMLLNEKPISEISQSTGYSETYLVKNKYRFVK